MLVYIQRGHVIALDDEGNRVIAVEDRENRRIRRSEQRRKAGRQLNAVESTRIRKEERHQSGKKKVVMTNREHRKAMREARKGIAI